MLYIHIPFCRSKCRYCGFYSAPYEGALVSSYIDTLAGQIETLGGEFRTIYIGGGTPTALDIKSLKKMLFSLRKFSKRSVEFTIEANPESVTAEKLSLFLDEGVNRISIGAQSFDNSKLKKLGRLHDRSCAVRSIEESEKTGFKNISVDLIFGVWDECLPAWKKDLEKAADLPVTHISCYSLTYEENTPIKESVKNGSILPLEEERSADMYEYALLYLADKGFGQYEISNFSKPGFCCKHNFTYWNNEPYIGLGPSAVSYADGVRRENIPDVSGYIDKVRSGLELVGSSEKLSPEERAKETAAIKIRTMEGIDLGWFKEKTGFGFLDLEKDALVKLVSEGLVEYGMERNDKKNVHLTHKGILFCDIVSSEFL